MMFSLDPGRLPVDLRRRDFLRLGGGLAASSLVFPAQPAAMAAGKRTGNARSCILVYLLGGPPHQDMFDLKPDAPAEVRGPFQPIATSVPGTQICEHLPLLAGMASTYALVRSVSHPNSNHTPMIYYTLTGRHTAQPNRDNDIRPPQRSDFPHIGAVLAHFKQSPASLPGYIAMPQLAVRSSTEGQYKRAKPPLRGGGGGFLGIGSDPLTVNGLPGTAQAIPSLALPEQVGPERFEQRQTMLSLLDRGAPRVPATEQLATIRQRAVVMTGSANARGGNIFSLDDEPAAVRDRYGRHRFGQTMLMARRLTGAGVPMVAIHFNEMTVCDGWDLHSKNHEGLKEELLPMLDQGLSALLQDLDQEGRLDETLVVCTGEFGRTPKINKNAGRDHWGECSTTLLAGGGIRGGQVHGASDHHAALPTRDAVDPVDIQATAYHCLGLEPGRLIHDFARRPLVISEGRVIDSLF